MSTSIPANILGISGQVVNTITQQDTGEIVVSCKRDKRTKVIDPVSKLKTSVNLYTRRTIKDLPLLGHPCFVEIELAQVNTHDGYRIIEDNSFVDLGCRHSKRLCRLISGLCRHMSISAVSKHLGIRWETIKNIDKCYLQETLPALDPSTLTDLKYIGVDEVARAKGHDYMTLVYDMQEGHLIWVGTGRTADVFSSFLKQLPKATANGIQAVAMDMGHLIKNQSEKIYHMLTLFLIDSMLCKITLKPLAIKKELNLEKLTLLARNYLKDAIWNDKKKSQGHSRY